MFDRRAPYIVQTLFYTSFVYLSALGCATEVRARCLKRNFLRERWERALQFIYQGNKGKVDFAASSPFSEAVSRERAGIQTNGLYKFRGRSNRFTISSSSSLWRIIRVEDSDGQEKGSGGNVSVQGTELITLKILYTDKLAASPCT